MLPAFLRASARSLTLRWAKRYVCASARLSRAHADRRPERTTVHSPACRFVLPAQQPSVRSPPAPLQLLHLIHPLHAERSLTYSSTEVVTVRARATKSSSVARSYASGSNSIHSGPEVWMFGSARWQLRLVQLSRVVACKLW